MDRIIVIGAGGHARSVLDILLENNEYEVLGCLDPIFPINKFVPKMPEVAVIGIDGDMKKFYDDGINKIFVAIGDNKLRKKLQDQAIAIGFEVINAVSKRLLKLIYILTHRRYPCSIHAIVNIFLLVTNKIRYCNWNVLHSSTPLSYVFLLQGLHMP